tara:strand:- start:113 stop:409 length:297 start_codon:yes stop_codon:yes gene_type:complete
MKDIPSFKQFVESALEEDSISGYYSGRGAQERAVQKMELSVNTALGPRHADERNPFILNDLKKEITELYNKVEGELKGDLVRLHRAVVRELKDIEGEV